jgi:hypothetical protein
MVVRNREERAISLIKENSVVIGRQSLVVGRRSSVVGRRSSVVGRWSLVVVVVLHHPKALQMAIHPKTRYRQKPIGALKLG